MVWEKPCGKSLSFGGSIFTLKFAEIHYGIWREFEYGQHFSIDVINLFEQPADWDLGIENLHLIGLPGKRPSEFCRIGNIPTSKFWLWNDAENIILLEFDLRKVAENFLQLEC